MTTTSENQAPFELKDIKTLLQLFKEAKAIKTTPLKLRAIKHRCSHSRKSWPLKQNLKINEFMAMTTTSKIKAINASLYLISWS